MSLPPGADAFTLADRVLAEVPLGEAEVVVVDLDASLTRYARNQIHQNVAEQGTTVRLRVVHQGRTGVAEVRGGDDDVARAVAHAAEQARGLAPAQDDAVLPPAPDGGADTPVGYAEATAVCTPEHRADAVAAVCSRAEAAGLAAFGMFGTTTRQVSVVSSRGVRRQARSTEASIVAVMHGADGAGYAARHAASVDDLDVDALAAEAVDTTQRNQAAVALDPGVYEVVLAPYAVAEMMMHLAWMGFSALAVQEGRSFMRPGERLMSDRVSIRDDPRDPLVCPDPFDWEGVSSRPVTFVDHGVCRDVVHDSVTARVDGVRSTGHALPMPNTEGPLASHLVVDAGTTPRQDLVAGVRRGLYVTRFWYVRPVHPLRTTITGMTREGLFLIEDGRLAGPVRDLRFTQSIVDALAATVDVSAERSLEIDEETRVLAPWMRLERFHFTS